MTEFRVKHLRFNNSVSERLNQHTYVLKPGNPRYGQPSSVWVDAAYVMTGVFCRQISQLK